MSNDLRTSMAKLTLLAGGAILGALLDYWIEEALYKRAHERSRQDKQRYSQGLAQQQQPQGQRTIFEITSEQESSQDQTWHD